MTKKTVQPDSSSHLVDHRDREDQYLKSDGKGTILERVEKLEKLVQALHQRLHARGLMEQEIVPVEVKDDEQ